MGRVGTVHAAFAEIARLKLLASWLVAVRCEQGAKLMASAVRASGVSGYLFPLVWLLVGSLLIYAYPDSGSKLLGAIMLGASGWFFYRMRRRSNCSP